MLGKREKCWASLYPEPIHLVLLGKPLPKADPPLSVRGVVLGCLPRVVLSGRSLWVRAKVLGEARAKLDVAEAALRAKTDVARTN